jgi:hypothetical protein
MQYQKWMFDDKQWTNVACPYNSWNILAYHVITISNSEKVSEKQTDFFDYTYAIMLQRQCGWH